MNKDYERKLEEIAINYHSGNLNDMWIEKAGQDFEWPWIEAQIFPGAKVLDLGYGDGHSFNNLKKLSLNQKLEVTVVEGAKTLVEVAIQNSPKNFAIVHGFFENFDTVSKFDIIIASHVLEHVDDPTGLLLQLRKLLNPDGIIIGIVPNSESIHRQLAVILRLQEKLDTLSARDLLVGHQRVYSVFTLNNDIAKAGFELVEIQGFFLKPFSNGQLVGYGSEMIDALLKVSQSLPPEICANLGFVCRPNAKLEKNE